MRTLAPSTSRVLLVLLANAALAAVIAACSNPDGVTQPDCSGPNGCSAFAACIINGMQQPASACCVADDGGALPLSDKSTCLYGYGDPSCTQLCMDPNGNTVCTSSGTCGDGGGSSIGDGGGDGG